MVQEESNKNLHKVLIKAVHPFICHLHKFIFILFHVLKTSQIQFKKYRRKIKIQQTHNFYAYLLQVNTLQFLLSLSLFFYARTHSLIAFYSILMKWFHSRKLIRVTYASSSCCLCIHCAIWIARFYFLNQDFFFFVRISEQIKLKSEIWMYLWLHYSWVCWVCLF